MSKSPKPDWYVIDEVPKYWDGEKWRRFKWPEPPGVYVIQDVEYYWNGSKMRLRIKRSSVDTRSYVEVNNFSQSEKSSTGDNNAGPHGRSKLRVFKIILFALYAFIVLGSVQTYSANYNGQAVFSFTGIIDNFIITALLPLIIYGVGLLLRKLFFSRD